MYDKLCSRVRFRGGVGLFKSLLNKCILSVTSQSMIHLGTCPCLHLRDGEGAPEGERLHFLYFPSRRYGLESYVGRCGLGVESATQRKRDSWRFFSSDLTAVWLSRDSRLDRFKQRQGTLPPALPLRHPPAVTPSHWWGSALCQNRSSAFSLSLFFFFACNDELSEVVVLHSLCHGLLSSDILYNWTIY